MIDIFSDITMCDFDTKIRQADIYFNNRVNANMLDGKCKEYMTLIDNATLIDAHSGAIKTPYGVASIRDLSTGCKTLIITYLLREAGNQAVIDVTECGSNVLSHIFDIVDNSSISTVLRHTNLKADVNKEFNVNRGTVCTNIADLCRELVKYV